jgi:hypothetical protein
MLNHITNIRIAKYIETINETLPALWESWLKVEGGQAIWPKLCSIKPLEDEDKLKTRDVVITIPLTEIGWNCKHFWSPHVMLEDSTSYFKIDEILLGLISFPKSFAENLIQTYSDFFAIEFWALALRFAKCFEKTNSVGILNFFNSVCYQQYELPPLWRQPGWIIASLDEMKPAMEIFLGLKKFLFSTIKTLDPMLAMGPKMEQRFMMEKASEFSIAEKIFSLGQVHFQYLGEVFEPSTSLYFFPATKFIPITFYTKAPQLVVKQVNATMTLTLQTQAFFSWNFTVSC